MTVDFEFDRLVNNRMLNERPRYTSEYSQISQCESSESINTTPVDNPPVDKFNFVAITFHLLGISVLLPFTFFVTANNYWMYKFRNVTDTFPSKDPEYKTEIQTMFTAYLALADNVTSFVISVLNVYFIKRISEGKRNCFSMISIAVLFAVTMVFIRLDTDTWQMGFFAQTMVVVVILNASSALFGGSMISLAAFFPSHIMHAMVTGQGLGGVVPSIASILSLIGNAHPLTSATVYFSIALLILFTTFICYSLIKRTEYFKYYMEKSIVCERTEAPISAASLRDMLIAFRLLWPYILAIFINFTATMSVCPGIVALEVSARAASGTPLTNRLFLPLACFLLFSLSDFCGRLSAGFLPNIFLGRYSLLTLTCVRAVFVPLLMLCNAYPRNHLPVVFHSDIYYITFMAVFGFTNGYCYSRTLIVGSKKSPPHLQNDTSILLNFSCELGVVVGSVITLGLIKLL